MIRPMQLSDIPRVAEIHVFGWRCAYRGIVSDEHLFNVRSVIKRMERFMEMFKDNDKEGSWSGSDNFVYDDGIVKATLAIGPCRDEDKPDAFELGGIYVDPCLQGKGIGTALATHCKAIATKRGYNEICLWTFEKNAAARTFYEKLGYTLDGTTQVYKAYNALGVRYTQYLSASKVQP